MRQLGQRRVVGDFVAAQVVVFTNRARLHGGKLACAKHGGAMMLGVHGQLHLHWNHLRDVLQQLTPHVLSEAGEGGALLRAGLVVHQQYGIGRIRVLVGIAQGTLGATAAATVSPCRDTVPAAAPDVPSQDGLIADEIYLAIGETLTGVHVGGAGLEIVTANLLGGGN